MRRTKGGGEIAQSIAARQRVGRALLDPHRMGVVGLDLSLTGAAACYLPPDWDYTMATMRTKLVGYQLTGAITPLERIARIDHIATSMKVFIRSIRQTDPYVKVYVEGYAFSARSSAVTKLAELGGAMRYALWTTFGIAVEEMVASRARVYLLGKLPRGKGTQKPAIVAALNSFGFEFGSLDEADAFVVANAARAELGMAGITLVEPGAIKLDVDGKLVQRR
ncbi:MAG: hypothetical protein M0R22_12900 [Dehalococcoidia bacterium]|nr:hypothetical protein [Dehalococcoidia bacterium]